MTATRKMITSTLLVVAFLSAGAFTHENGVTAASAMQTNVTVIAKTADASFALL